MKKMVTLFAAIFSFTAVSAATPTITGVTAHQRYPWNGKVDIDVQLTGSAEELSGYEVVFAATNVATKSGLAAAHIEKVGEDVQTGGSLTQHYVWDAKADVGAVKIDELDLTVDVFKKLGGVQLWDGGPYFAECNVGATKSEEYGYYFWWGDTVGYKRNARDNGWVSVRDGSSFSFSEVNCPTYNKTSSQLQSLGYIDSTGNLVVAHDAATAHLGAPWRMPTVEELDTLVRTCDSTWTMLNGVYGRLITGRGTYSSKSIFLPAAGSGYDSGLYNVGSDGYFWFSTPTSSVDSHYARDGYFSSDYFSVNSNGSRYGGQSVRPVRGFGIPSAVVSSSATTRFVYSVNLTMPQR